MTRAQRERVCVIGLWHLGTVTAACLAELGYLVVGVDADPSRVADLNNGQAPLYEPGLDAHLAANRAAGRLSFTDDVAGALRGAGYVLITYDTPVDDQDNVDLSQLFRTAALLGDALESGATVIVSSQVPVGTCEELADIVRRANPSRAFGIAYVPENLRLGQAIERFKRPDMVVIGADTAHTHERVSKLFAPIEAPKVAVALRTAEMVKHAINTYLALCISFANELANLSDLVGADAIKVMDCLRLESRVSPRAPLFPGLGFAGGTLARDLKVMQGVADRHSYEAPLISGILRMNALQNAMVLKRLEQHYGSLQELSIGVLGLTYKPDTSTLRRSAAIEMIHTLTAAGASVQAYDPKADEGELAAHRGTFTRFDSPYEAAAGCDALVLVTPWPEFKEIDFPRLSAAMRRPFFLDAQNMLDPAAMARAGFVYQGIGRSSRDLQRATP